jgi:hypothetical protein
MTTGSRCRHRLTTRDVETLRLVHTHVGLTPPQIDALVYSRSLQPLAPHAKVSPRCHSRLRFLSAELGLLRRVESLAPLIGGRRPYVYFLSRQGAELLAHETGSDPADLGFDPRRHQVSQFHLRHLVTCSTVRICLEHAATAAGLRITSWLADRELRSPQMKDMVTLERQDGRRVQSAVVPDAFFTLEIPERSLNFMVEVDLATVTGESEVWNRRTWARKVAAYVAYVKTGSYERRYHSTSLRVLTVCPSAQRVANLRRITETTGGRRFWFSTIDQLHQAFSAPIWSVAGRDGFYRLVG